MLPLFFISFLKIKRHIFCQFYKLSTLLLFIYFLISSSILESKNPSLSMSLSQESDPAAFVHNVNIMFENLLLGSTNIIQNGPIPLNFNTYYDSSKGDYAGLSLGWTHSYPMWIEGISGSQQDPFDYALVDEDGGSTIRYSGFAALGKKKSATIYLSPSSI
ncbi:MAG: DUF6531 domain-containing protein [Chlamydia sp.]